MEITYVYQELGSTSAPKRARKVSDFGSSPEDLAREATELAERISRESPALKRTVELRKQAILTLIEQSTTPQGGLANTRDRQVRTLLGRLMKLQKKNGEGDRRVINYETDTEENGFTGYRTPGLGEKGE